VVGEVIPFLPQMRLWLLEFNHSVVVPFVTFFIGVCCWFLLVNGNKSDKLEQTLKDAELIKQFKQLDQLPEEEKKSILKVLSALIRDFNARQAYVL
jgi:hypothetical protein